MPPADIDWDENRGGTRNPENLISAPDDGTLYLSIKDVLPWTACGAHDTHRMVLPSYHVEQLFGKAPVTDASKLSTMSIMTRCLNITNFLADAVDLLISEGLFEEGDEDGHESTKVYDDIDELMYNANKLVLQLVDNPVSQIDDTSFDWLEGYTRWHCLRCKMAAAQTEAAGKIAKATEMASTAEQAAAKQLGCTFSTSCKTCSRV